MEQQIAEAMGPDMTGFEYLIRRLMSPDNDERSMAESLYNACRENHPDALVSKLAHLLLSSVDNGYRGMAAVLLRKLLTSTVFDSSSSSPSSDASTSYVWPRLSMDTQAAVKSMLIASVQKEDVKSISKKLCDTVSELASNLLSENGWPELMPFMFQSVTSESSKLQESALLIFSQLAPHVRDTLYSHLSSLHDVFLASLTGPKSTPDVRIAALSAAINLIQCLSVPSERDLFQDLLPAMMQSLNEILQSGLQATAQDALELLIELAMSEPRFLRKQLAEVVNSMLQIAEADGLEDATKHLAVEFIITLAEARDRAPGMMRRLPQFVGRLFAVLMKMLLDLNDDPKWHSAELEFEDAGETSKYCVAQECLDRLSISMGGNTILPVASELLPMFFDAPEWQKHHAALITLSQIAEGCSKVLLYTSIAFRFYFTKLHMFAVNSKKIYVHYFNFLDSFVWFSNHLKCFLKAHG